MNRIVLSVPFRSINSFNSVSHSSLTPQNFYPKNFSSSKNSMNIKDDNNINIYKSERFDRNQNENKNGTIEQNSSLFKNATENDSNVEIYYQTIEDLKLRNSNAINSSAAVVSSVFTNQEQLTQRLGHQEPSLREFISRIINSSDFSRRHSLVALPQFKPQIQGKDKIEEKEFHCDPTNDRKFSIGMNYEPCGTLGTATIETHLCRTQDLPIDIRDFAQDMLDKNGLYREASRHSGIAVEDAARVFCAAIYPSFQRKGIIRNMFYQTTSQLRKDGIRMVFAETTSEGSKRLLKLLGWEEDHELSKIAFSEEDSVSVMRKYL